MSTAIMSQNPMYDFGDNMLKVNKNSELFFKPKPPLTNLQDIRNSISGSNAAPGAHLSVDASAAVRLTLTRMSSNPPTTANTNQLAMLLGLNQHRRLERTQSAPAPATTVAATTVNTSRYKTELCRPFEEFGVCKYGDKCQFAHGINELRSLARHPKYKTELCRTYHTVGFCPYGPRCHFVHNQDEVAIQKGPQVSALLNGRTTGSMVAPRPRPAALSPSLSLDSPSPPCSLSQSPTSSMGSFFNGESELHSPDDQRLPVFSNIIDTTTRLTIHDIL